MLIPILVVIGAVVLVLGISLMGSRAARFEVSSDGLRIRGDWYGRFIPAESIRADQGRRVDLTAAGDLRPRRRTLGTGLPGYQSGWFRLAFTACSPACGPSHGPRWGLWAVEILEADRTSMTRPTVFRAARAAEG